MVKVAALGGVPGRGCLSRFSCSHESFQGGVQGVGKQRPEMSPPLKLDEAAMSVPRSSEVHCADAAWAIEGTTAGIPGGQGRRSRRPGFGKQGQSYSLGSNLSLLPIHFAKDTGCLLRSQGRCVVVIGCFQLPLNFGDDPQENRPFRLARHAPWLPC